jgi:hypothetical protein
MRVLGGLAAIAAAARSAQFNAPGAESDTSVPLASAARTREIGPAPFCRAYMIEHYNRRRTRR